MKKFVLAKNAETGGSILIEWDDRPKKDDPSITITEDGVETEYRGYVITEGVVGKDMYFFRGRKLAIYDGNHQILVEKFPTAEHLVEYMKADEWLCRKEDRQCKAPLAFMTNWFKRARGGNFSRGGVIY